MGVSRSFSPAYIGKKKECQGKSGRAAFPLGSMALRAAGRHAPAALLGSWEAGKPGSQKKELKSFYILSLQAL